ncbi:RDD family protein [Actinoplanes sp. G11-F43]|uniref:RDD family protein n=1 Tax=Actinoplanes sp. G11-F43 TaxID=3424130 RepID=UPI003D34C12D
MNYAGWFTRVVTNTIDGLVFLPAGIAGLTAGEDSLIAVGLTVLAIVPFAYNRWFLAGRTGQSWGRKVLGVRLVGADSGQPIGAGRAAVRDLAHLLDTATCYLGYLLPLVVARKQTIADMVCRTVVVKDAPAPAPIPAGQAG